MTVHGTTALMLNALGRRSAFAVTTAKVSLCAGQHEARGNHAKNSIE